MVFDSIFKSVSLSVLAGAVSIVSVACGSAPKGEANGRSSQAVSVDETPFLSCATVDDCVVVAQAGCCDNGYLAAVAADQLDAYAAANACAQTSPICPMFRINDTRIPQCNAGKCAMVQPPPPTPVAEMGEACGDGVAICDDGATCMQDDPDCDPTADGGSCTSTCRCD